MKLEVESLSPYLAHFSLQDLTTLTLKINSNTLSSFLLSSTTLKILYVKENISFVIGLTLEIKILSYVLKFIKCITLCILWCSENPKFSIWIQFMGAFGHHLGGNNCHKESIVVKCRNEWHLSKKQDVFLLAVLFLTETR